MGIFDDDSFDEIVREFFGEGRRPVKRRTIIRGEEEDRNMDFIEDGDHAYLILELPGFSENDIIVDVEGNKINIKANKKDCETEGVRNYLSEKLCNGLHIRKTLPNFVLTKGFKPSMKNGVLELKFNKK
jgi:HSP20 family molecular chaperone IbpA